MGHLIVLTSTTLRCFSWKQPWSQYLTMYTLFQIDQPYHQRLCLSSVSASSVKFSELNRICAFKHPLSQSFFTLIIFNSCSKILIKKLYNCSIFSTTTKHSSPPKIGSKCLVNTGLLLSLLLTLGYYCYCHHKKHNNKKTPSLVYSWILASSQLLGITSGWPNSSKLIISNPHFKTFSWLCKELLRSNLQNKSTLKYITKYT